MLDLLFPPKCLACGAFIEPRFNPREQVPPSDPLANLFHDTVCVDCRQQIQYVQSPLCSCCGQMFASRQGADHLCGRCLTQSHPYHQARAVLVFDGPVMDLIHHYKYQAKLRLAKPFGILLHRSFQRFWPTAGATLAMPVPLHGQRRRQRGFNQAYVMLLRAVKAGLTLDVTADALRRVRNTPTQTGLDRQARKDNMRKAFVVKHPKIVAGRHILLVDDVMTTGATLAACAQVLRSAGAIRVDALTLARVL